MKNVVLILSLIFCPFVMAFGQQKVNDGTIANGNLPNIDAILDLESSNKGLLHTRVALRAKASAFPLSAHVAGMMVYNTATVGDVIPGIYYNDGVKWIFVRNSSNVAAEVQLGATGIPGIPGMPGAPAEGTNIVINDSGTWVFISNTNTWVPIKGTQGLDGKSAFEVWQAIPGNEGKTIAEYLASLKGESGLMKVQHLSGSGVPGIPGSGAPGAPDAGTTIVTNDSGIWVYDPTKRVWTEITRVKNGLTIRNGIVQLGGLLTEPTSIATSKTNTLALIGLEQGSLADRVVVADSLGVLKTVERHSFENKNIYNSDAGLTDHRIVHLDNHSLNFEGNGNVGIGGLDSIAKPKLNVNGFIQFSNHLGRSDYGVGRIFNDKLGDKFGLTQVGTYNGGLVTTSPGTRIYTSGNNNTKPEGHISFGKYTSASAYYEFARFRAGTGYFGLGHPSDSEGQRYIRPTERLDVLGGNVRIRDINLSVGDAIDDKLVVADSAGVLKTVEILSIIKKAILEFKKLTPWQSETGNVAIGDSIVPTFMVGKERIVPRFHVVGNFSATGKMLANTRSYADYVFEKYFKGHSDIKSEYQFRSLEYVKDFIKRNNHLPGLRSINDLKKGANGYTFDITELSIQSLEKIEELYLHVIEQQEEIGRYQAEVDQMKTRLEKLEKMVLDNREVNN